MNTIRHRLMEDVFCSQVGQVCRQCGHSCQSRKGVKIQLMDRLSLIANVNFRTDLRI